uniref:BICD family-like cargo adapter 2 n=1 Tax=Chrysemys picta bellii TaxID=8478 RepID=A0A8C3FNW7_CHRPI
MGLGAVPVWGAPAPNPAGGTGWLRGAGNGAQGGSCLGGPAGSGGQGMGHGAVPLQSGELEQEKYELRRRLESEVAEWETRGAELEGDLAALRAQLGHQRLEQQDTSRESSQVAQELSEQNQRLAEQLSQASQLEQRLQDELMALRVENRTLGMSSAEHAARTQSLQAENLMLQERKQELERQTRQLREEMEAVQGLVETLHENLLLLRREVHEKELQLRAEAEELRVSNRWLQRRVTEMADEIRLHDSDASIASLQLEIEQSGEGSPEQNGGPAKVSRRALGGSEHPCLGWGMFPSLKPARVFCWET